MEFDPLARDVAPPRHEIESDSEDESSTASQSRRPFTPPRVKITWQEEVVKAGSELLIFHSDGGEAFLRSRSQLSKEIGKVIINDEQHGSLAIAGVDKSRVILLLRPSIQLLSDQASLNYFCQPILDALKPSKLTIVDDYNPSLYITSRESLEEPIRYVSNQAVNLKVAMPPGIELFETPNYVLGLAAAMMNESNLLDIPSTVLLLPRPVNPHLQSWSRIQANSSSLDTQPDPLPEELADCLASLLTLPESGLASTTSTTSELLDFLHTRRSRARKTMAQNVSAMYV